MPVRELRGQGRGLSGHRASETEDVDLLAPEALAFARLAASSGDPVLLHGETGAGKTCLARLIHRLGSPGASPFVHVNCASIPETLFEREMFGHVRGAFTDARESRPGLVEAAEGGTLFLDEVGELPAGVQPKLLQVLEEGAVRRLGAAQTQQANFRLIAATNRDLRDMLRRRTFREDLYYRCAVLEYRIPPLRERRDEIAAIVARVLAAMRTAGPPPTVAPDALALLRAHDWPGNLRELDNSLRQAVAYARGGIIRPHDLPERVRCARAASPVDGRPARGGAPYVAPVDADEEVRMIREALEAENGNKTRAAQRLGMSRATLWIKLQRHATRFPAGG